MSQAPGPTLTTERLILRPPHSDDFEGWAAFMADDASRFVGGPQPRAVAWRGLMTMAGAWALNGFAMFSVVERDTGLWVGRVGPWRPEAWPGSEVGWGIIPQAQGKGYAFESATATIDWAFDHLAWTDVIHCIDVDNAPSQAVARKLGSRVLGETRLPLPMDVPVEVWGQSRAEWKARNSA